MSKTMKVEITGRNTFWENAVQVEWEHQFPERKMVAQGNKFFLIEPDWLEDIQRIANQCFSKAIIAPRDVGKRDLFRKLFRGANDEA